MAFWPWSNIEIRDYTPKASAAVIPPARSATSTRVTPDEALSLASVYRAVSILSTSIKQLPLICYKADQPVENRLAEKPDVNLTLGQWLTETTHSLALFGNAFWWKTFNDVGQCVNVTVLDPNRVTVVQSQTTGPLPVVKYYLDNDSDRPINRHISHLRLNAKPGQVMGFGPVQAAGLDIRSALRVRAYADAFFDVGTPVGVLSTDQTLNQEQAQAYREAFSKVMSERSVAVLGSGMEYRNLYQDPKQSEYTDVSAAHVTNMARLFGIPPMLLATGVDGSSLTYASQSELMLNYIQVTLAQYLTCIEEAFTEVIPRGQRARLKLDSLLRASLTSRVESYQGLHAMGVMSADEIRASEGMAGPAPGNKENNQANNNHLQDDGAPV